MNGSKVQYSILYAARLEMGLLGPETEVQKQ